MSYYVLQDDDDLMPDWLKDGLSNTCKFCKSPMENYYNDDKQCTNRRCSNPVCPETLAQKLYFCIEVLGLKGSGIGIEKCRTASRRQEVKNHFECFPNLFTTKPKVNIYQLLRMCCISGVDTAWEEVAAECTTVDEIFNKYNGKLKDVISVNAELIKAGAEQVEIIKTSGFQFEPLITGTVMMTGDIKGFSNREDYLQAIAIVTKGYVRLTASKGVRKTGIMALIKEDESPVTRKVQAAVENNIPIFNSEQFNTYLTNKLVEKLGGAQ